MAWLSGWSYRKEITITGQSGAGTDFQVEFDIGDSAGGDFHLEGHCTNFPQDIEVTDNDGTTPLDFWIEDITADPLKMWVEVADDLGTNKTIYIYYGKSGATTNSNIGNTFILGDDFSDGDYTSDPTWTVGSGTWSAADYYLKKTSASAWEYISTPSTSAVAIWEYKYKAADNNAQQFFFMSSTTNPSTSNGYFVYLTTIAPDRILLYRSNGGSHQQLASVNHAIDTTWHDIKITRDSSDEIKVYFDDVLKITHTDATYTSSSYVIQRANYQNTDQIDDIRIRKYNSPEPAFSSAGSEETPPVIGHPWFYERKQ